MRGHPSQKSPSALIADSFAFLLVGFHWPTLSASRKLKRFGLLSLTFSNVYANQPVLDRATVDFYRRRVNYLYDKASMFLLDDQLSSGWVGAVCKRGSESMKVYIRRALR